MNKTLALASFGSLATAALVAQSDSDVKLPELIVLSPYVANQDSVGSFSTPVSVLRFDPKADVQGRNFAEAQADISIRGGVFENSGFKLGALNLYDPQTGHYLAEIPVAPQMLSAPTVLTGVDNAQLGMGAIAGTIEYGWREIKTHGSASLAAGQARSHKEEIYQGYSHSLNGGVVKLGMDLSYAHSESDGSISYGDHNFQRTAGRFQIVSPFGQTDLVGGYQEKFFGWPNLYTPYGVNESESLRTTFAGLNHLKKLSNGDYVQLGASWKRNHDDYEYNRLIPGLYNPYIHTSYVYGFTAEARNSFGLEHFALNSSARAMFDRMDSSSLTYGRYRHRDYTKLTLVPEYTSMLADQSSVQLKAGASYDDTNKNSSAVSPVAELSRSTRSESLQTKTYVSYARSTQVASYTALNANPKSGLFRGNANLDRTTSDNLEVGGDVSFQSWRFKGALFWRQDDDLVDWTFATEKNVNARTATAVDVETAGVEFSATRSWRKIDLVVGYTGLTKEADYGPAGTASFYAPNYPKHRMTLALVAKLGAGVEVRVDNEARVQTSSPLRRGSSNDYFLSNLGVAWRPSFAPGFCISGQIDNLWDSSFEEVPSVPASPRQASVTLAYAW